MPVITLLQDVFMAFKGPYERYVGKHTVNFCKRVGRQKLHEGLRQTLIISAVSADEVVAALLKVDNRRDITAFSEISPRQKPKPSFVKLALKAYMSALLVVFGAHKQQLLAVANKNEQEFIKLWIHIFGYDNEDMALFNDLLQSYQKNGLKGISEVLAAVMDGCIWEQTFVVQEGHLQFFAENIAKDVAAIVAQLDKQSMVKN